jgi:hypothetical protein
MISKIKIISTLSTFMNLNFYGRHVYCYCGLNQLFVATYVKDCKNIMNIWQPYLVCGSYNPLNIFRMKFYLWQSCHPHLPQNFCISKIWTSMLCPHLTSTFLLGHCDKPYSTTPTTPQKLLIIKASMIKGWYKAVGKNVEWHAL